MTTTPSATEVAVISNPLLAWLVEINSMTCIVFAATKAKAQWIATKSYWEAGYGHRGQWPRAVASREPRYDKSTLKERPLQAYSEDYVSTCTR
jgi:hypothetical protein